jgi:hypothetical protein
MIILKGNELFEGKEAHLTEVIKKYLESNGNLLIKDESDGTSHKEVKKH